MNVINQTGGDTSKEKAKEEKAKEEKAKEINWKIWVPKIIIAVLVPILIYLFISQLISPYFPAIDDWLIVIVLLTFVILLWLLNFPPILKKGFTFLLVVITLFFAFKTSVFAETLPVVTEKVSELGRLWVGVWCTITTGGDSSCFEKETEAQKIGTYDSLSVKLGRKISGEDYIPNPKPEAGKDYTLEITLENNNDPTTDFDVEVMKVNTYASSKKMKEPTGNPISSNKTPYTIRAGTYRVERLKFDTLPSCDYYMYFFVQVKSKQKGGGLSNFRIIPKLEGFERDYDKFEPSIKTQPGPIDAYVYTSPSVINLEEERKFEVIVRIVNKGEEGIATINSINISSTFRDLEITCPDFTTKPCSGQENCISVYLSPPGNTLKKRDVIDIECVGNINPSYNPTDRVTGFISVSTDYEYTQDFSNLPPMLATCYGLTTTTIPGIQKGSYCTGTATSCASLNQSDCGDSVDNPQYGCYWEIGAEGIDYCIGTATSCSSLTDENKCKSQQGCAWIDVKQKIADTAKSIGVPADYMLAIADVESGLQHWDQYGNVKIRDEGGGRKSIGIMQVLVDTDGTTGCGMTEQQLYDLDNNIKCGAEIFRNKCINSWCGFDCSNSQQGCKYNCTGETYYGWDIATRGYNGWGCRNPNYVELVKAKLPL